MGENYLATNIPSKRYSGFRKKKNMGSIPYGLPTEAVYYRTTRLIERRQEVININKKMIKFMKLKPAKQILFVPEAPYD